MRLFNIFVLLFLLNNCSFDDKTGIWKNENTSIEKSSDKDIFKEFKKISIRQNSFDKIIPIKKNFTFKTLVPTKNLKWNDIFYGQNNNLKNFKYNNNNQLIFKSRKLSKPSVNNFLLFEDNNLILSNNKGDLITFSVNENKIISKFNFYKKNYKKINKRLNLSVNDNITYVADNLGYLYAYNFKIQKVLWAKNYKIPFRSNIKIFENKLIVSSQNNNLYFINKRNGELLKLIPTEENIFKNQFINNLSINKKKDLFYLNSFGSLYSVNLKKMNINWFINLNQTLDLSPNNLFLGNQIVNNDEKIIVSSNDNTYIINTETGSIINKFNFSSSIKPLIHNNYVFLITKNNLIVAVDLKTNKIIYSYRTDQIVADFLDIKKKNLFFQNLMLINNNIFIFLKNSYILIFEINGKIKDVRKLPSSPNSFPIIINNSILYLDKKNKLIILD